MAVSQAVSFKSSQIDIFQCLGNQVIHVFDIGGVTHTETIAGPAGGVSTVTATFANETPGVSVIAGSCYVTAETVTGVVYMFVQSSGGTTWGAAAFP